MKKLFLALALFSGFANAQTMADVDRVMTQAANQYSRDLPRRIDSISSVTKVQYITGNRIMMFTYDVEVDVQTLRASRNELATMLRDQNCSNPRTRAMLDIGITLSHTYYAGNTYGTEVRLNKASCL